MKRRSEPRRRCRRGLPGRAGLNSALAVLSLIALLVLSGTGMAFAGSESGIKRRHARMTPGQYLDALLKLPGLSGSMTSPDGKWVVWTWFRTGPGADLYLAPADASTPPVRLTETPEDTMLVSWTMDSKSVVVSQDHDGDEREQLFRVDIGKPLTMVPLTEPHPDFFLRGGDLHPNKRWLVYGANYDFEKKKEQEETFIYRQDLESGIHKVLARPAKAGYCVPELSPDGTLVLYNRNDLDPAGQQIWLVDIEGRKDREILNFGPKVKVDASWCPDGRQIIFLTEYKSYHRLGLYDVETGATRWLIDDPARNLEAAFVPFGSKDAVVLEVRQARVKPSLLNLETGQERFLPELSGNLTPFAPTTDGRWVGEYYSSTQPGDIVVFPIADPGPENMRSVTGIWQRTTLKREDLTAAQDFSWRATDGLEIHGWLYRARQPVGTIVLVHGGPTAHSEDSLDIEIQYYVARGFNVLDPNYRGSTGYNLDFQESIKKQGWGGAEQDDIAAGIKALIAGGIAQSGKVGITGTSYGGYSSWYAITHFPADLVAAAAPICGMTDLVVDYETTRPDLRPYSEEMMGGSPTQVPERYKERSPINYVGDIKGRLLIVQGLKDPNVTPQNVSDIRAVLDKKGIAYDLLAFKDEGHGIGKPRNQRKLYTRLADFFAAAFSAVPSHPHPAQPSTHPPYLPPGA